MPEDYLATYLDKLAALTPTNIREAVQVWLGTAQEVFITIGPDTEQVPLPAPLPVDQ
ncbi:hypothetical protein D3C80_2003530 [compost metagenome]